MLNYWTSVCPSPEAAEETQVTEMERLQTTDRLTGIENWGNWKMLMEDILFSKDCNIVLKSKKEAQEELKMSDEDWNKKYPDEEWNRLNRKALTTICPCLSNGIL